MCGITRTTWAALERETSISGAPGFWNPTTAYWSYWGRCAKPGLAAHPRRCQAPVTYAVRSLGLALRLWTFTCTSDELTPAVHNLFLAPKQALIITPVENLTVAVTVFTSIFHNNLKITDPLQTTATMSLTDGTLRDTQTTCPEHHRLG